MIETNIVDVPMNTWWLDIGATIHVTNSLQGMISQRGPTNLEQHVYMGDSSRAKVDIMRIIKLKLATGYVLELQEVSYIPSIRRNLLSISLLDSQSYSFLFGNNKVEMYKDGKVIGFGTLCGNLYRLDLFSNGLNYSVNSIVGLIVASKHPRVNDNSSMFIT